jgi:hypothetical protein
VPVHLPARQPAFRLLPQPQPASRRHPAHRRLKPSTCSKRMGMPCSKKTETIS